MKLHTADFALDCVEFADRFGILRTTYGCSLLGADEFRARLEALTQHLESADQQATIAKLYKQDKFFRHHCDRCLQLNGVDPDWLDAKGLILEGLLFTYDNDAGLLIRLNSTTADPAATAPMTPATTADVGATLLALSSDLSKVIEQLNILPAKQVASILEARAKQVADSADPETKRKKDFQSWAQKMRSRSSSRSL